MSWWTTTLRQLYDRSPFKLAHFGEGIVINEKITVRRIHRDFVGAEYCDDAYRHELDFYVMHALGIHVSV
jgi:hypothetical protein